MKSNQINEVFVKTFIKLLLGLNLLLAAGFYTGCQQGLEKTTPLPGRAFVTGTYSTPGAERNLAPEGSFPSSEEELWVIARRTEDTPKPEKALPESGAMLGKMLGIDKEVPLPL